MRPAPCPSWKIQVSSPKVAPRLSPAMATALTGSTTVPKARNSSSSVAPTMTAIMVGSASVIA